MLKKRQELLKLLVLAGFLAILAIGCDDNGPPPEPEPPKDVMTTQPGDGATVPGVLKVEGIYIEDINDDIWVFIWPDLAPDIGWPQSDSAESGAAALKESGRWSVTCYFGGPPQDYEIAVYTASASASAVIANKLKEWYRNNNYPGIAKAELPAELDKRDSIRVKKLQY